MSQATRNSLPRVLPLTALLAAAAVVAGVNEIGAISLFGLAGLAALVLFPALLLPLLIAASAFTRLGLQSGDAQIRIDLIVVGIVAAVVANRVAVRTLPLSALHSPLLIPLTLYLTSNVFSTLAFAAERTRGLKLDVQILAVVVAVVGLSALLQRQSDLTTFMRWLWFVTVGEALVGLVLVLVYLGGGTSAGVQSGDFGLPMAYGTSYEANIFGSFLAGNFFILLADYVENGRSWLHAVGLVTVLLAVAASETRTAWLGIVVGIVVFAALVLRRRGSRGRFLPVLVAVPLLAMAAGVLGAATPLAGRLLNVVNLHTSSASGRLVIFQAALNDWRTHPIFGSGTGSFNFGAAPGQPHPWLPNLLLLTLNDTGLVGLLALGLIVAVVYRRGFQALRQPGPGATLALGAVPGFTALLLAFQTTSGFWFLYPWIVATAAVVAPRFSEPSP